ncbi:uncharacterized protein LOC131284980 [Anopheles ziemanni]|uniref:uncharacterized protein LOC131284980 n=1 Tax=Anopheles ziemanni TaxID=345580 RepID=UPI00265ECD48|nr:uncharacterized protein LOC131284980 [Anopheles ziemanni]
MYQKPENKQPAESLHVPQPGPSTSAERQATKYTTTVYNITSHDMSNSSQKIGTFSVTTKGAQPYVLKQPIRLSQPIMEVISYQKSNSDAYAKHLQEITKSAVKKVELPKSVTNVEPPGRTEASASTMTNHKDLNDFQHRVSIQSTFPCIAIG